MSRKKSQLLDNSKERVLHVIKTEFKSEAEFCREGELSHNWVQYFKKADEPSVNDHLLSFLYESKNVNPLWVIKKEGPYKIYPTENHFSTDPSGVFIGVNEGGETYQTFRQALDLIDKIEQTPDAVKEIPLPEGIEIQLAELLVKLLKRREGS